MLGSTWKHVQDVFSREECRQSVKEAAENCSEVMCVTVSGSCGKLQRGVENQLEKTRLDYHTLQISDYRYVDKVENLRQKLRLCSNTFDAKSHGLIRRLFPEQPKNHQDGKNLLRRRWRGLPTWKDMLKNAWKVFANWQTKRQSNYTKSQTSSLDDHYFKKEELESVGKLSNVCSHIVLKCLYLARIGRPDMVLSGNKLARSVTRWTRACDRR